MIERNVNLQACNTLGLASIANAYSRIYTLDELHNAIIFSHAENLTCTPLGEGSNVILQDTIDAHILDIRLAGINKIKETDSHVWIEVAAGENWHNWVMHSIDAQWFGLENLALIPGRVGAAPIQNIGAYGCEVSSLIDSVNFVNLDSDNRTALAFETLTTDQCQFAYRDSVFKQALATKTIITSVVFKLDKIFSPQLSYPALTDRLQLLIEQADMNTVSAASVAEAVIAIRSERLPDPKKLANAGSFFKNIAIDQQQLNAFLEHYPDAPHFQYSHQALADNIGYKIPAAWLIEQCGFKGQRSGNLGMHKDQALVLIHYRDNTASDVGAAEVIRFTDTIIEAVKARFGFILQREPQTLS
ncbi:MAG TPA: UDP-N-acetylenolpyruvoylglucosamine reductase [Cellvibrionales bacterium]|nr:UDP-N-acetylenolpyruvoylglucosamine reductase [Cellvibrionales bacterium]